MPQSILLKTAIIGILLLGCGILAAAVFNADSPAKINLQNRTLEQLLDDLGIEKFSNNTSEVAMRLQDLTGTEVGISDFRGNIVFLNFWTTWCPTCVTEMPSMEKLQHQLIDKEFIVVTISIRESAETVQRFFNQHKLTLTALLDSSGKTIPAFGIRAIPTTFILDKTGRIIGRAIGPREWDSREAITLFNRLVDGPATS